MENRRLKLSTSIQTFEIIRTEERIYVDKTKYLVEIADNIKVCFLARPRRFGKSLTVSTFEALFSGRKDLFKGLYAEEFLNRPEFTPSPVIKLDMSEIATSHGIDGIRESLVTQIQYIARQHDVSLPDSKLPSILFNYLIKNTYYRHNQKVVILVDEYDAPYTEFVNDTDMADKVRAELRDCYKQLKANDSCIRFIFLTGISKFARFGVFSTLNNPTDISSMPEYAGICGLTEDEIVQYFPDYLDDTAKKMDISTDELLEKMRYYYNGFCFDRELTMRLYNSFSTLQFFTHKNFLNFWVQTGRPKVLSDYMKYRHLTVEQFRNFSIPEDFAENPGDVDTTTPEGFLYQCGYLTLRDRTENSFLLDYPNTEVLNSMSALVVENILRDNDEDFSLCRAELLDGLREANYRKVVSAINRLLAGIPYVDFSKNAKKVVSYHYSGQELDADEIYKKQREWIYRSNIISFFRGCGIKVIAELHTKMGRSDTVIFYGSNTWIIELKVAYKDKGHDPAKRAEEAFRQIEKKNYAAPFPNAICAGMAIDDEKRQITEIRVKSEE